MRSVSPKRAKLNRAYEPTRLAVLERDGCCIICGGHGTDVHHRKQKSLGGLNDPENLVTLCRVDHSLVHDDDTGLYLPLGLLLASWDQPHLTPLWHNARGEWMHPLDGEWEQVPDAVSRFFPMDPALELRERLDARQRLFTLVHNSIPQEDA